MKRLVFALSEIQHSYLFDIKKRHGISMSAQIRSMIRDRMEGRTLTIETRSRSRPIHSKIGKSKHMPALLKEMKQVFTRLRPTPQTSTKTETPTKEQAQKFTGVKP